jgi:hypothetical protein
MNDGPWMRLLLACSHSRRVALDNPSLWTLVECRANTLWQRICLQRRRYALLILGQIETLQVVGDMAGPTIVPEDMCGAQHMRDLRRVAIEEPSTALGLRSMEEWALECAGRHSYLQEVSVVRPNVEAVTSDVEWLRQTGAVNRVVLVE